jgi:hypothetical protein
VPRALLWTVINLLVLVPVIWSPSSIHGLGTSGSRVVREVAGEGACAIFGMSAEQSQLIALQKARSSAIETATGVRVVSSTLVRDGMVAVDLIRTYSRGFIIAEKVEWLPLAQYQESPERPPIPEYRVRIKADVAIPEDNLAPLGLTASLNNKLFRSGENATLAIETVRDALIAVLNITADDQVVLLFPNIYDSSNRIAAGRGLTFPSEGSRVSLEMQTLPGHERDAEAFFVIGVGADREIDFLSLFGGGSPLPLASFFRRYSDVASVADEVILTYAVENGK